MLSAMSGADYPSPAVQAGPISQVSLGTLARTKEDAEAARITAALVRNRNNRLRTAAELGISRMTLYKKLNRYGLMAPSCETVEMPETAVRSVRKDRT